MKAPLAIPPSARLRFRLMDEQDADLLFDLDQDPEVMHFMTGGKPTPRDEITDYFIPRMLDFTDPESGCGIWAAISRDSDEFLGWILVREYGFGNDYLEPDNLELGWRFKRHCWGKGIATEAAGAVLGSLKQRPEILRFCAIADRANVASTRVMEKLGMQFGRETVHVTPKDNHDVDYYDMPAR